MADIDRHEFVSHPDAGPLIAIPACAVCGEDAGAAAHRETADERERTVAAAEAMGLDVIVLRDLSQPIEVHRAEPDHG